MYIPSCMISLVRDPWSCFRNQTFPVWGNVKVLLSGTAEDFSFIGIGRTSNSKDITRVIRQDAKFRCPYRMTPHQTLSAIWAAVFRANGVFFRQCTGKCCCTGGMPCIYYLLIANRILQHSTTAAILLSKKCLAFVFNIFIVSPLLLQRCPCC